MRAILVVVSLCLCVRQVDAQQNQYPHAQYSSHPGQQNAYYYYPYPQFAPRVYQQPRYMKSSKDVCCARPKPSRPLKPTSVQSDAYLKKLDSKTVAKIFYEATAKGVENAVVRAMNSTKTCPGCLDCLKVNPNAGLSGNSTQLVQDRTGGERAREHVARQTDVRPLVQKQKARTPGAKSTPVTSKRDKSMVQPIVYWHPQEKTYKYLNPQGKHCVFDSANHPNIQVTRDLVTNMTTVSSGESKNQYSANWIPPQGIWWNDKEQRLETTTLSGQVTEFEPRAKTNTALIQRFDIEFNDATSQVVMTHKETQKRFYFEPLRDQPELSISSRR